MGSQAPELHLVLFPLLAQGHLIAVVDIGRILAQRGATVTIITSPVNADRFRPVIANEVKANVKIQILELKLPLAQFGLPEGCESFDLVQSSDQMPKLFAAISKLEGPAESLLKELSPAPSCILSDNYLPWTMDLARRLSIPRYVFHGQGCFPFLCMHIIKTTKILDRIDSDKHHFSLPGLPDHIEFTKPQLSCWGNSDEMGESDGLVFNSCEELEGEYAEQLAKLKGKNVWCLGPVALSYKNNQDVADRGNKPVIDKHECLRWLDSREPGSVIYVCLGSLSRSTTAQAIELALGLELSNRPFVWSISKKTEEFEKWYSEEGFEERVKDRGLIIHGWAPQILILSHQAIGGFLTHCGWNSVLETVCAGIPTITWPHFGDHFLNEKFILHVLKIGLTLGVEVPALFLREEKVGVLVRKEDVKTAVEKLMGDGEEGRVLRERAKELARKAKRAMDDGGSSHLNVTSIFQHVTETLDKIKKPNVN